MKASYLVALLIANKMKLFSDGKLVKDEVQAIVKKILPDKSNLFLRLSRQTITRRNNDISEEIVGNLRNNIKDFKVSCSYHNRRISPLGYSSSVLQNMNGCISNRRKM